ncbi:TPA: hypothetical protein DD690_02655 [Candidatus Daviesbacteria bacterium]|nr:hypothetical protein [Candidatus Daviesbacteria bacterium]
MSKEAFRGYLEETPPQIPANVLHRVNSHNQRRRSARKPLEPQPLKIATRYHAFNQAQANSTGDWSTDKNGVNTGIQRAKKIYKHHLIKMEENERERLLRRTKEKKQKRNFTPLKKTLLDRLVRERFKTQKNFSKFHTARFVNGKKEGRYPILRKELMQKLRRLDDQIAKEATRFTPLKELMVFNGISLPLNTDSSFDKSLNRRIKQLRRILFLDEDQAKKSGGQAIAMDGLFALESGKGLKFLAQLILGKENADSGFMKRTTVSFADRNKALRIADVLELINSGEKRIPIAQVKDDKGMVIIQISYLKGDKISIEIPGKFKPADLEQAIDKWLKAYDAESY